MKAKKGHKMIWIGKHANCSYKHVCFTPMQQIFGKYYLSIPLIVFLIWLLKSI